MSFRHSSQTPKRDKKEIKKEKHVLGKLVTIKWNKKIYLGMNACFCQNIITTEYCL